jgi:hypothetical protein
MSQGEGDEDAAAGSPAPVARILTRSNVVEVGRDEPRCTFGRAAENRVRIGHAPQFDRLVPRLAGEILFSGERPLVSNLGAQLSFSVLMTGRPAVPVLPGDAYGPGTADFSILFEGEYRHTITVSMTPCPQHHREAGGDAPHTHWLLPHLTDRQRRMLELFTEPLRHGQTAPLSHQQVADHLRVSRATVRLDMSAIWDAFSNAGVPMRPHTDRRDEVLDAWMRHRLTDVRNEYDMSSDRSATRKKR